MRRQLTAYIKGMKLELLRESSPILLGIYTIIFGLFATESLQRAMRQILPSGVGHLTQEGMWSFAVRGAGMAICFLVLCIGFVHGAAATIRMRLDGGMISIYARTLLVFSWALVPWCGLHVARLVLMPMFPDFQTWISPLFLVIYGTWIFGCWILVRVVGRLGL